MTRDNFLLLFFVAASIGFSQSMEKPDNLKVLVINNIIRNCINYRANDLPEELIELIDNKKAELKNKLKNAIKSGQIEEIKSLLLQGASQNIVRKSLKILAKRMLLINIMFYGLEFHPELLTFLINNGADINIRLKNGQTLLMVAIKAGIYEIIKFFLDNNIDLNAQDNSGRTALMHLIVKLNDQCKPFHFYGDERNFFPDFDCALGKALNDLLTLGADVTLRDNKGKTLLDYAYQRALLNEQVICMIKAAEKKQNRKSSHCLLS